MRKLFPVYLLALGFIAGCAGVGVTISIAPTSVTVPASGTVQFTATVTNDPSNRGITWTLTQGGAACSAACGTIFPTSTASGAATTYTAPGAVPSLATVTVTATSVADSTKSASATVIVGSNPNNAKLRGNFAFLVNGFNGSGAFAQAGSFVADGTGNITSGVIDTNGASGLPTSTAFTGTYSIGSDSRGTLTLSNGQTFRFAIDQTSGNGRIVEFDATSGTRNRSSGFFKKQDTSAFSTSAISGDYAFGFSGAHFGAGRFGLAGRLTADGAGNFSNGVVDTDDAGTIGSNLASAGSLTAPSTTNGSGTLTLSIATLGRATTIHASFYIISAGELIVIDTDLFTSTASLFSGQVLKQSGVPFSNSSLKSSLNSLSVISLTGLTSTGGSDLSLGLVTFSGSGAFTLVADENKAGTLTLASTTNGTYSVSSNGRVTTTAGSTPPVFYLVTANEGFVVGTDNVVTTGFFEPQAAGPFMPSSISGMFALGTLFPAETNVSDTSGVITSDGVMTLSGKVDNSFFASPFLSPDQVFAATYTVASNGSGTMTISSPSAGTASFRIVNSKKVAVITTDSGNPDPQLIIIGF